MRVGDSIQLLQRFRTGLYDLNFPEFGLIVRSFSKNQVPMFTVLWNNGELNDFVSVNLTWYYEKIFIE